MGKTEIEWTDHSWNPVTGCSPISIGCQNCYAEKLAATRLEGRGGYPKFPNHFKVTLHPNRLDEPMKLKKPQRIFVCSMSDLFHEDIPDHFRDSIFNVMQQCPQHTFQLLTKRPHMVLRYLLRARSRDIWLLPHMWLGASASTQVEYDGAMFWLQRIGYQIYPDNRLGNPKYFISLEPLLEMIHLQKALFQDWIIAGAETGPKARPICLSAFRVLRDRCAELEIPYFLKQTDKHKNRLLDGRMHEEFPKESE